MIAFDKQESELRKRSKEKEVDEDGFELVKPSFSTTVAAPLATVPSKKRKSAEGGLSDFYRFQLKERKKEEWAEEKRQESLDKDRFNEMKSQNKFQL